MALALSAALAAVPAGAHAATLSAGAGKADITPQTGYVLGGWTRADRTGHGQHTRLFSRAIVLQRGNRKVALVSVDLFMIPGGLVKQIADSLRSRGFSEQNILISASHTHSGPGGYANFNTLNTTAPSTSTVSDPLSFFRLLAPAPADRQLYTFLQRQMSTAIRRADDDLAPAGAAWGHETLLGVTENRSLEAHLADHGLSIERGHGHVSQDPGGYRHTIDPDVNVLRVDKVKRRCVRTRKRLSRKRRKGCRKGRRRKTVRVPIGAWSTFADHGTVTKSTFQYYNADHHASAMRVFESRVRKRGKVGRRQEVLNVYGNADEGDISAGLTRSGPAASDEVGRFEAAAMYRAWSRAGRNLTRTPALDTRWTRSCFCGQETEGGRVANESEVGLPFLTGSEEGRGPLYDITGEDFEGDHSPVSSGAQGDKLGLPGLGAGVPHAFPLLAVRVGREMIVSVPGESTKEVGARIKAAVTSSIAGSGIHRVVLSGLANEFLLYFTTPEEYQRQHYEGGNTQFGRFSSNVLRSEIAKLAGRLARGEAAPAAYPFDPTNGVTPNGPAYGPGAASGRILSQPGSARRFQRVHMDWQGGPLGLDRPVDKAFVSVQRRARGRWRRVDSDLGLNMLWTVDSSGRYSVTWDIPWTSLRGPHRLVITAKRYRLVSRVFSVRGSYALRATPVPARPGRLAVQLAYPRAVRDVDLNYRPALVNGGHVHFRVGGRIVVVKHRRGSAFSVRAPAGSSVSVASGGAHDRYHNVSRGFVLRP
jgi:neutral ceramidase